MKRIFLKMLSIKTVFIFLTINAFLIFSVYADINNYDPHSGSIENIDGSGNIVDILNKMEVTKEKIVKAVISKNLREIHHYSVTIQMLSQKLLEKTKCLPNIEVQGVCKNINQLMKTTELFHIYADQEDQMNTLKEGLKLAKLFKLLEKKYSHGSLLKFKKK